MTAKMTNREYVTRHCIPDKEVPFSEAEYAARLVNPE